ncbi:sensor histidine kinase [Ekhidna sp.]|uniref:sensor histidine kinase n=1 Tax=Ekhidna sp. TaxID=2608089 RepID=UPI003CCBA4C1
MKEIKPFEWLIHALVIVLGLLLLNYPAFDLTFGVFNSGDGSLLWPSVLGSAFNLILFYGIAFYLIPITLKRGTGIFIIRLIVLYAFVSSVEVLIDSAFYRSDGSVINSDIWSELVLMVVFTHTLVTIMAFAYRFSKDWFANERTKSKINEHQLRSELDVLKSQINPHFLFNALNNLYSMSLQSGDEKTAEGISVLSEMMRYVFDKTGEDKVALQEEVQYISDYIYLQQLRFNKQVKVQFDHPESISSFYIAPMLLIPFVENAFKYGVSNHAKTTIEIRIAFEEGHFVFEVKNQKAERTETIPSSGVGLSNVKKRLNLVYNDKHSLSVSESDDTFKIRLIILNSL